MKQLLVFVVFCLVFFRALINAVTVKNKSSKDFEWRNEEDSAPTVKRHNPERNDWSARGKKLSRRERCCILGKEVAKIGQTCTYTTDADHISRNSHYHQMKTSVWMGDRHPIKRRLLLKCKPYKSFYEKCCKYESSLITKDLLQAKREIEKYLRKMKKNEVQEDEGSSDVAKGGLPAEESDNSEVQNLQKNNP